ncbi:Crp/Fnr family transcriptional regulator [Pedobacter jeongneungensis]|uniref:Crp/Fnr family transcriptional regulator n=1 Tax=Pedobacter jeongneungensis TaxID=947309 RepID=UPI00068E1EFA|nr:Crp/Fnr family transcriptional regulator [Pedobacter jeongneungensis]
MIFEVFKNYLQERISLTGEELRFINSLTSEKRIKKSHFLLQEGEYSKDLIFVAKGILILDRTDQDGKRRILKFATENNWLREKESYSKGTPSSCNIQAIEDSEILIWKKEDFRLLLDGLPPLKQLMKGLIESSQIANQDRIFSSISSSAEEKYLHFIAKHQNILNRIPLFMVASYLGLARETLSRIRKNQSIKKN